MAEPVPARPSRSAAGPARCRGAGSRQEIDSTISSPDRTRPREPDLALDLDFAGHKTQYASHGLHSFAAKFPPQLVRWGIERYSTPGQSVLDPMSGSGTTLVEARLLGRHALGVDIDPLARLIARVKATPLDGELIAVDSSALLGELDDGFARL